MKTITENDYLRIVGLLTLARDHNDKLADIARSVAGIVGEDFEEAAIGGNHSGDAVYGDYPAAELLRKLEIRVIREVAEEEDDSASS